MPKMHPWDAWFAALQWPGDVLDLRAGRDFRCTAASMVRQFEREAERRSVRVAITAPPGGVRVALVLRGAAYPWGRWLDGEERTLVAGADFPRAVDFPNIARIAARRRGQKVSIRQRGSLVRLQALAPPRGAAETAALEALGGVPAGTTYRLPELEALAAPLCGRRLAGALRLAGWSFRRTASARIWTSPDSNALESAQHSA